MRCVIGFTLLAGLLVLGACVPPSPPGSAPVLPNPTPSDTSMEPDAAPLPVRLSIEHLSKRLGVPADQITLVRVTAVAWKDASLGCPKPGIDYIRVETPGYSVQLEAGGAIYTYHTDEGRRAILCGSQAGTAPSATP